MDRILTSLAHFSTEFSYRNLPPSVVSAAKDRMLDALGCGIGAHDCDTAAMGRSLAGPAARRDVAGRVLGSKDLVAADAAGFVNTCMIRNLDFNDTYLPGGHPSDCSGGLFAIAPRIGASGERLIAATVVAYEIFIRLQMSAKLRERGWDQGFGIGVATAAGLANLMGLDRDIAQHALAITAVANVPMRATRAGQLSMWKGVATAYAVRNAVFAVELASDHSLPYILAWTLKHGGITPQAFLPESYLDPSIRPLMNIITARVDDEIEKAMPRVVRMRLSAKDRSGKSYEVDIVNAIGHEDNPLSASDLAAKFTRQCEPRLGEERTAAALEQWRNIEATANVNDAFDAVDVLAGAQISPDYS